MSTFRVILDVFVQADAPLHGDDVVTAVQESLDKLAETISDGLATETCVSTSIKNVYEVPPSEPPTSGSCTYAKEEQERADEEGMAGEDRELSIEEIRKELERDEELDETADKAAVGTCKCTDPLCPVDHGKECKAAVETALYRVDMEDETGTLMCRPCADDALDSGVFREEEIEEEFDDECAYRIQGWSGVAWHKTSPPNEKGMVKCVMIGDDREFEFPEARFKKLEAGDYCSGCGQVGCKGDR